MSAPSAHERVKRLESRGVIRGFSARRRRRPRSASASSRSAGSARRRGRPTTDLTADFATIPEVEECHHVAGEADYLLKIRAADTRDLERVMRSGPGDPARLHERDRDRLLDRLRATSAPARARNRTRAPERRSMAGSRTDPIEDARLVAEVVRWLRGRVRGALRPSTPAPSTRRPARLSSDRQLAEDVVQETFLALWNRAEQFDPTLGSLSAWLLTIARNRTVDRLRAAGRRPTIVPIAAARIGDETDAATLERVARSGEVVGGASTGSRPRGRAGRRRAPRDPARRAGRDARARARACCSWPIATSSPRARSRSASAGRSGPSRPGRGGRSSSCAPALGPDLGPVPQAGATRPTGASEVERGAG